MKLADCKIGLKVKVLGKTIHGTDDHYPALQRGWGYIRSVTHTNAKDTVYLTESIGGPSESGGYSPNDLEPYTEPEETEYRQLKDITPRAIYEAHGFFISINFMQELIRFVHTFDLEYEDAIPLEHCLATELNTEPEWTDWLIQHGFIEKVVEAPKPTYLMGDRFKLYGQEYILSRVGMNEIILTNLCNGNMWTNAITVKDTEIVTHADLIRMFKNHPFTKIDTFAKIEDK